MIIGGIAAGKGSNSARKSYARSVGGLFYPKKKKQDSIRVSLLARKMSLQ